MCISLTIKHIKLRLHDMDWKIIVEMNKIVSVQIDILLYNIHKSYKQSIYISISQTVHAVTKAQELYPIPDCAIGTRNVHSNYLNNLLANFLTRNVFIVLPKPTILHKLCKHDILHHHERTKKSLRQLSWCFFNITEFICDNLDAFNM